MAQAQQPGTFIWNELTTRDTEAAKKFYGRLFGWKFQQAPNQAGTGAVYDVISVNGTPIGGIMKMGMEYPKDAPPHWLPYVAVANVDKTCSEAEENGGKICVPPTDIPGTGRFAVITDPTGGVFSILSARANLPKTEEGQ